MKIFIYFFTGLIFVLQSCETYLDIKPRSNLVIPETLDDMEQLLDNGTVTTSYPEILELQADDFYFEEEYWKSMFNQVDKNTYVWENDIYGSAESHSSWSQPYHTIFYANAVLDGLKKIDRTGANTPRYDQIKGSALFLKAESVYVLAQLFSKAYDVNTAEQDLGIPVPLSADVNEAVSRPSLAYTFDFITSSLTDAEKLLTGTVDFSRPSKAVAHALLARVYLYMGNYGKALYHSDSSLGLFDEVIDLNKNSVRDYKNTMLLRAITPVNEIRNLRASTLIDTLLIDSYHTDDKRSTLFYSKNTQGKWMKQRFNNLVGLCFSGFDADEQFLIRAECYARDGRLELALSDLNHLLINRFKTGELVPYASVNKEEVLSWILTERRKELIFRCLRWSDLKRLNIEGHNITLTRKLGNDFFRLQPHDPRWVLPIPTNEINLNDLLQNER